MSKHSLPNCLYVYSDVAGVISSFYTFNAQVCRTWHVQMCSLKKSWGDPCTSLFELSTLLIVLDVTYWHWHIIISCFVVAEVLIKDNFGLYIFTVHDSWCIQGSSQDYFVMMEEIYHNHWSMAINHPQRCNTKYIFQNMCALENNEAC